MVRPTYVDSNGMKKGAWSEEEDNKLRAYIQRYGHWNWRLLPKYAGLARCGKSCRLRWVNYLKPGTKHGNFTKHEEDLIIRLHNLLGNRWSAIAAELPGRTDNEIKNFWHTHIKKHAKRNADATRPEKSIEEEQISGMTDQAVVDDEEQLPSPINPISTATQILDESNDLDFSNNNGMIPYDSNSPASVAQSSDILWAEPFLDDYNQDIYINNNFPPLQEDELFNSGLIQEHNYGGEYLWSFDYSFPSLLEWNRAEDVVNISQSGLPYFSPQEEAGESYDHCFDHGMGLF